MTLKALTEAVIVEESGSNIRPELDADTPLTGVSSILVAWIAPQALAHDALISRLPDSLELRNVL